MRPFSKTITSSLIAAAESKRVYDRSFQQLPWKKPIRHESLFGCVGIFLRRCGAALLSMRFRPGSVEEGGNAPDAGGGRLKKKKKQHLSGILRKRRAAHQQERSNPGTSERQRRPHFHFTTNPVTLKQAANSPPSEEPLPGYLPLTEPAVKITRPNAVKSALLPPAFYLPNEAGAAAGREMKASRSKRCLITSSGIKRGGINRGRSPRRCRASGKQEWSVYS